MRPNPIIVELERQIALVAMFVGGFVAASIARNVVDGLRTPAADHHGFR